MAKQDGRSVTKPDIREIVSEIVSDASDRILEGIGRMFERQNRMFDRRFGNLEAGHADMKRQLTDLKVDTPTRKQFQDLDERVEILEAEHMD